MSAPQTPALPARGIAPKPALNVAIGMPPLTAAVGAGPMAAPAQPDGRPLSRSASLQNLYPAPTPPLPETPSVRATGQLISPQVFSPPTPADNTAPAPPQQFPVGTVDVDAPPTAGASAGILSTSNSVSPLPPAPARPTKIAWRRKLVLVLVGLPARGKSYIAYKLLGYLRWRGLNASLFNVGKHRRHVAEKKAEAQSSDFFSPDNAEAKAARDDIAMEVLECMLDWLGSGGDVSLFDATNTTAARRRAVLAHCQARSLDLRVIFLESICDDPRVLENNYRVKVANSPDYKNVPQEEALADLRQRVANYEKVYESIDDDELSYIKLHNLASKVLFNKIHGQLSHAIAAYLMSIHVMPRPIFFVRAGHSESDPGEIVQQSQDRQIMKLPEAHKSPALNDFHIPYTISMAANLDARGASFASRLSRFITHKVEEYTSRRDQAQQELAKAINEIEMEEPDLSPSVEPLPPPTTAVAAAEAVIAAAAAPLVPLPPAISLPSPTSSTVSSTASTPTAVSPAAPAAATPLPPPPLVAATAAAAAPDTHLPLVVYTSTLPRAIQTAADLKDRAYIFEPQSALNMMDTGVCSGMSINEIREEMPQELEKWQKHKYKYRFPGGESQADRAKSLEPLVFELERQTLPVLVVSHMSTLQVLMGFFYGSKRSVDSYYSLWIPQHVVLELIPHQYGWLEIRHDLSDEACMEDWPDAAAASTSSSAPVTPRHRTTHAIPLGADEAEEVERFNLQVVPSYKDIAALGAANAASTSSPNNSVLPPQRPPVVRSTESPLPPEPRSLMHRDRSVSIPPPAQGTPAASPAGPASILSRSLDRDDDFKTTPEPVRRFEFARNTTGIGRSSNATVLGQTNFYDADS